MQIKIQNCNNIEHGVINVEEGRLNIKYAINGTGKSTIAKALSYSLSDDPTKINDLMPFKYVGEKISEHTPKIEGIKGISSIAIFDEDYINQYIYQPDELIKNSFNIFVKTPEYDKHIHEIEKLVSEINTTFQNHPELDSLITVFSSFIEGFGKSKSGYSASGAIGKGLGKGNKIENIPKGLEVYTPYLHNSINVKWLKWQLDGKSYLDIADQCPYCSGSIAKTKDTILKVSEEYNANDIQHLDKMLEVFSTLAPYFSNETNAKLSEIAKNITGITPEQKNYLLELKKQIETFLQKLLFLKHIGFDNLKDAEKISDELKKYIIDLSYFSHLNSETTQAKVKIINSSLDNVLEKAGKIQGEVAQQKQTIKKTIEEYSKEINDFLYYAGYKYSVSIQEDKTNDTYKLLLKHNDAATLVEGVKSHLSYGERNALALVLFMYGTLKENPDLIVLDDPISSFDGNKKFAILNMLFMGKHCFKDRTVILLTHEFSTVIDSIYTMPYNFNPNPKAAFLSTTSDGVLSEKPIEKKDIQSFTQIAKDNIQNAQDTLNKLVYLRRLYDIQESNGLAWQLLSNIFHNRKIPEYHYKDDRPNRPMTQEEIDSATMSIKTYISDFDYNTEYEKTQNRSLMAKIYRSSPSNYEKLQLYRILFNENSSNDVIKKYVNETFHIENDYIFQLNPLYYDTVPQYIIDECNIDIDKL